MDPWMKLASIGVSLVLGQASKAKSPLPQKMTGVPQNAVVALAATSLFGGGPEDVAQITLGTEATLNVGKFLWNIGKGIFG